MGIVFFDDHFDIRARNRRGLLVMNFPLNLYLDEKELMDVRKRCHQHSPPPHDRLPRYSFRALSSFR